MTTLTFRLFKSFEQRASPTQHYYTNKLYNVSSFLGRTIITTTHNNNDTKIPTRIENERQQQKYRKMSVPPVRHYYFSNSYTNNNYNGTSRMMMSSVACEQQQSDDGYDGPYGELFQTSSSRRRTTNLSSGTLIGQTGCIHRTFSPRDNIDAILVTGGEALAAHASFDPNYTRAQSWIRQHAVGSAVLSPILLHGLIGALTEAAFPEGVLVNQSMEQMKPLIVGVAIKAKIEIYNVEHSTKCMNVEVGGDEKNGYMIYLKTEVSRIRDDELIVTGTKQIWIPDYENM